MKHLLISVGVFAGAFMLPAAAFAAAANISFTAPLTVGGSTKDFSVSGSITSITVSPPDLNVTLAASESLTVTSPDKGIFTFSSSAVPSFTETCGSTYSVTFTNGSGGATKTFSLSPSTTLCGGGGGGGAGSGGGSGGGGGGGGGGLPLSTPAPAPTPAPTLVPPPAVSQPSFSITSDLAPGSKSNEVAQLQAYLATMKEIYPEGLVTGYFGPATERAVRRFQSQNSLPSVGRVGPLTRAKLAEKFGGAVPAPVPASAPALAGGVITRSLSVGSRSDDVSTLQAFLAKDSETYPEGLVTGYFGPATERAVRRFQEKYGIEPLGIVGPLTRAKLNELLGGVIPTPPAAPSAENPAQIESLQAQLKVLQDQLKVLQGQ